jgi:serine/threonine protein kinase
MPLTPGTRLGPYDVLALIGAGGMGEVYRARDSKLNREVAIKVLPAVLARDPERMARFEREAKTLAALNHPNIAHIYGLEESPSGCALVMELVPGETLKGPLPLETTLRCAKQIADALETAHEKGIIHRDLKPGNIMITPEGIVKVLDFGLAAVARPAGETGDPYQSPTVTAATQPGVIMGTAAYMSPEQAAGKPVDKRTDIWSFGVVLYEIMTGTRLFTGETISDTLADVLRAPIDFDKLPAETPRRIRELLGRCLNRDAKRRLRDIGEARIAIEESLRHPENHVAITPSAPARKLVILPWAVAAVSVAALAVLAWLHFYRPPPVRPVLKVSLPLPAKSRSSSFALSPDGRRLAVQLFSESGLQIWIRALDSPQFQPLAGTDDAFFPFWSFDSKSIGFFTGSKLRIISADGGPSQTLCDGAEFGAGGTWNRDGVILFAGASGPLRRVNASGGPCTIVTRVAGTSAQLFPQFLPDGKHFVFTMRGGEESQQGIYAASLDEPTPRRLLPDVSAALYAPSTGGKEPGYLLFLRGRNLMAQPFDPQALKLSGDVSSLGAEASFEFGGPYVLASVSNEGMLLSNSRRGFTIFQPTWLDESGKELGAVGPTTPSQIFAAVSPDGTALATGRDQAIWLTDLGRGGESRLTPPHVNANAPVWSPDSVWIAFGAGKGLYAKDVRGAGQAVLLFEGENTITPSDWSRDGHYLIYTVASNNRCQIQYMEDPLNRSGRRKAVSLGSNDTFESEGQVSPDGRWLVYTAATMDSTVVYVRPFPVGPGRWKVSGSETTNAEPRWRSDGKAIFYLEGITPMRRVMAVPVHAGLRGEFQAGIAKKLFEFRGTRYRSSLNAFFYQPGPDGRRFFVNVEAPEEQSSLSLISNWEKAAFGGC